MSVAFFKLEEEAKKRGMSLHDYIRMRDEEIQKEARERFAKEHPEKAAMGITVDVEWL